MVDIVLALMLCASMACLVIVPIWLMMEGESDVDK
jgi:hypothetical protein